MHKLFLFLLILALIILPGQLSLFGYINEQMSSYLHDPKPSIQGTSSLKFPIILISLRETDIGPSISKFNLADPFAIIVPGRFNGLGCKFNEVINSGSVSCPQFIILAFFDPYFSKIFLTLNLPNT